MIHKDKKFRAVNEKQKQKQIKPRIYIADGDILTVGENQARIKKTIKPG